MKGLLEMLYLIINEMEEYHKMVKNMINRGLEKIKHYPPTKEYLTLCAETIEQGIPFIELVKHSAYKIDLILKILMGE